MTHGRAAVVVIGAALAGVAWAAALEPDYFFSRGFPLDGAWIHAVYGRSLVESGMFAYNPGIPATGITSPLWAAIVGAVHLFAPSLPALLLGIKLVGAALHALGCLLLLRAFTEDSHVGRAGLFGCVLAALHPDVVSASLSGMEVPLAAAIASGLLVAATGSAAGYGILSFVAPLARPELTLLSLGLPVALFVRHDRRRLLMLSGAAALGNAAAFAVLGMRNMAVSGALLPASFHANVGAGDLDLLGREVVGFRDVLGHFVFVDSSILMVVAMVVAVGVAFGRAGESASVGRAAAALLAGLLFCVGSFALVAPIDPKAFFHQRYVLPALPLMVAAMPILVVAAIARWLPERTARVAQLVLVGLVVLTILVMAPGRYRVLSNDAHNIDDVQVRMGRHLAQARPDEVVWAVDAGAVRYFGQASVVDLLGRHTFQVLGPDAQRFLDRHRPRYIEEVPLWTFMDDASSERLAVTGFKTTTGYTATSYRAMRQHWLVLCDDPAVSGQISVRGRLFRFRCGESAPKTALPAAESDGKSAR